jgi:hypothetical protein
MADRVTLANEIKQLKADQERRATEWKENQQILETKAAELVQANLDEFIMSEVQKQLPSLVKGAMPSIPSVPKTTGPVNPFAK